MFTVSLKSFAKLNIGLRILRKRDDGFHDLETIYYPVSLHDNISVSIQPTDTGFNSVILKSNISYLPLNRDNLCYKAVENFFKMFKIKDCYKINIYLKKNIPIGGGLGGGSSNAAAIIKFLIKFFKVNVEDNRRAIILLSTSIGSDVPFFLTLKPCYAEGRGEKLKALENFKLDYDILIVNPNLHVSTKWAFEKLNMKSDDEKKPVLNEVKVFSPVESGIFTNDFEELVFKRFNILKEIKEELTNAGAVYASMSGSGATMFALFAKSNNENLKKCKTKYSKEGYFTYIS